MDRPYLVKLLVTHHCNYGFLSAFIIKSKQPDISAADICFFYKENPA